MKKFLILFLLLASCQLEVDKDPIPEVGSETISWNSMTFELPETWDTASVSATELKLSDGTNDLDVTWDAEIPEGEFEKIQVGDQNYEMLSEDPLTLSTSWSTHDVLINANMSLDDLSLILAQLHKSRIEWMGYEFDRPIGLDWFEGKKYIPEWDVLAFREDDGNFLENEAVFPCYDVEKQEITGCDYAPPMVVSFVESDKKLNEIYKNYDFYDEVDFNGIIYEVLKYTSELHGTVDIVYKSKVGDKYLQIDTVEEYDEDAQDILNEVIGL